MRIPFKGLELMLKEEERSKVQSVISLDLTSQCGAGREGKGVRRGRGLRKSAESLTPLVPACWKPQPQGTAECCLRGGGGGAVRGECEPGRGALTPSFYGPGDKNQ